MSPHPTLRLALTVLAGLVALASLLGFYSSNLLFRPRWYEHRPPERGLKPYDDSPWGEERWQGIHHDPGRDLGLAYEPVQFTGAGGATLRGWFVPARPEAEIGVVTVHGGGWDRRDFLRHVPIFHEAGFPVLLFDCREHGVSDGSGRGIGGGIREAKDVSAAVGYVKRHRGLSRVVVLGTSLGGAAVILAAASDPAIDAVIAENPFTRLEDLLREGRDPSAGPEWLAPFIRSGPRPAWLAGFVATTALWRLSALDEPAPIDVVHRIAPRPLLLIHGSADSTTPPRQSEAFFAAARDPKLLWIAPGAEHSVIVNRFPGEYRLRVLGFLRDHVAAADRRPR